MKTLHRSRQFGAGAQHFLNAVLFWGCVSAAIGLLGQFSGLWISLNVISQAETINPSLVFQGLMESFSSTILGLVVMILSAVAWFTLKIWATHRLA